MIPPDAYPHDTPDGAARSFPSLARVPAMVQVSPGVWVRADRMEEERPLVEGEGPGCIGREGE